jgi:hypothetical protein
LRLHELAEPARRPHPQGNGIGFGLMIVGDPGSSSELGSHALDGQDFVDRLGLGQGATRRVIPGQGLLANLLTAGTNLFG